jgi:hypothetical protein
MRADKRRKPTSIAATPNPRKTFTLVYEKKTSTPRATVTGDLLLTNLLSQQAAAPTIWRVLTPAAELKQGSAILSAQYIGCSLNHIKAPGTYEGVLISP